MKKKLIDSIKRMLPENALLFLHRARMTPEQRKLALIETPEQRALVKLQKADYSYLKVSSIAENICKKVRENAQAIYGENWNLYSNALRREVVHVFETSIQQLSNSKQEINYLEIGSCQGLSMSLIGSLLQENSRLGQLVSIDPYFEQGYHEGAKGITGIDRKLQIDKNTRDNAYALYSRMKLNVRHIETVSNAGLRKLILEGQRFDMIYIDGSHEGMNPLRDLGLSLELIEPDGIILLDDPHWPDVKSIKDLCERHCKKVTECWKIAAYQISPN